MARAAAAGRRERAVADRAPPLLGRPRLRVWRVAGLERLRHRAAREALGRRGRDLVLGVVWLAWHFVPFVHTVNSAEWVARQSIYTLGLRMSIVHGFAWARSGIMAATLIHAVSNVGLGSDPQLRLSLRPHVHEPRPLARGRRAVLRGARSGPRAPLRRRIIDTNVIVYLRFGRPLSGLQSASCWRGVPP